MSIPVINTICPYKGLLKTDIYTFSSTYVSPSGGNWNPTLNAIMNIDGPYAYVSPDGQTFMGMKGNVISKSGGITPFSFGTSVGAIGLNAIRIVYQGGSLHGFYAVINPIAGVDLYYFAQTMPLDGIGINIPGLPATINKIFHVQGTNSAIFSPYLPVGFQIVDSFPLETSFLWSARNGLDDISGYVTESGFAASGDPLSGLGPLYGGVVVPFNDFNYVLLPPDQSVKQQLVTDFVNGGNFYPVTFINPPGDFDLDTMMKTAVNYPTIRPSLNGFQFVVNATKNINGVTVNGFVVAIQPDFSGYYIIQINGTDANSKNWNGFSGLVHSVIGYDDILMLKPNNNVNLIFSSINPIIFQPQFSTFLTDPLTFYVPKPRLNLK